MVMVTTSGPFLNTVLESVEYVVGVKPIFWSCLSIQELITVMVEESWEEGPTDKHSSLKLTVASQNLLPHSQVLGFCPRAWSRPC